ncbi:uncharacterized protein LOC128237640 [Mya arenaria]|uniref:uncharacterized protein LOC128237640 n=1 Tax=Mya arenaria TaxID=6604 RepID=UPI0022E83B60|nr:uncharacterized protein LOC128237640 [Mya arenaria]
MMKFYIKILNSVWIVLILNFTKNVKAGQCSFEVERCGWGYIQTVNSFDWSVGDCNRLTHKITDNKVSCAHIGLGLEVVERRALLRLPLNLTSAVISFQFFINTGAGGIKMYLNTASYEEQYWSSYGSEYNKWIHLSLCFFGIRQPAW